MENKENTVSFITNYLFIHKKKSENSKKLKRQFNKKYDFYKNNITINSYIHDFNNESLILLSNYLKKNISKDDGFYGVITDDNKILQDILIIPKLPDDWDILCLQSDIKEYDFSNSNNNIYWSFSKINDTKNFVINGKSINKILNIIKKCKTWEDFINETNTNAKIFTINDRQLSKSTNIKSNTHNLNLLNENLLTNKFDEIFNNMTNLDKYKSLPSISLISVVSDNHAFFHTIYTFLKLYYPKEKLQLIIVIDDNLKFNEKLLPKDDRINIINVTNKNEKNQLLPLGYKLNAGIKYAKYNLISHFFDTNNYKIKHLFNLVKCYMSSKTDCILSIDTGILSKKSNNSFIKKIPDICNMFYRKEFWFACHFDNYIDDKVNLLNKFAYFRSNCLSYIPFMNWSFKIDEELNKHDNDNVTQLPFALTSIVDTELDKSLSLILQ